MKYAFFDIDNTLYDGYITSGFYLFLANKGYISEEIYTEDKWIGDHFHSGKIDYAEASRQVLELTAKYLRGKKENQVACWQKEFGKVNEKKLFPWVNELVSELRHSGYKIYLISAAANLVTQAIADRLKADRIFSTEVFVKNGVYTGKVGTILNYEQKKDLVHKLIGYLPKAKKIGFGDSTGDVDMLSHMDVSYLYKPKNDELVKNCQRQWMVYC